MNNAQCKTALVTGGNRGIGYEISSRLIEEGYKVTLLGRDETLLKSAVSKLGDRACYLTCDLKNIDIRQLDQIQERFSDGLDVLVNNAAVCEVNPGQSVSDLLYEFDTVYKTNVLAPIMLVKCLQNALAKRKGRVTNVSSIAAHKGFNGFLLYSGSKSALEASTRTLAVELGEFGIQVNTVVFGAIDTGALKCKVPPEMYDALLTQQSEASPLKTRGTPSDAADVIMSQLQSHYVTGAVWVVDGGITIA